MARYALLMACNLPLTVALWVADVPYSVLVLVGVCATWLLTMWSCGLVNAHLQLVADLDDVARRRWRIVLYLLPWSLVVYWLMHVRPTSAV